MYIYMYIYSIYYHKYDLKLRLYQGRTFSTYLHLLIFIFRTKYISVVYI